MDKIPVLDLNEDYLEYLRSNPFPCYSVCMASILCDIVLLPSERLAEKLIALSEQFKIANTFFTLDGRQYFPHLSLYMTQLKVDDLDKVAEVLTLEASKTQILDLIATGYGQVKGFLDVEYQRIEALDALQITVVNAINPIRDEMIEKDKERMREATDIARDNFEKFGYKYVGELFRPHATLTRFIDEHGIDISDLPEFESFSGQFTKLGLFEMGGNGTCIQQIAAYDLT